MGHTVAVESATVEAPFAIQLEYDPQCIAYYAQPSQIPVKQPTKTGKLTSVWRTIDFLVFYVDRVELVECKPEEFLQNSQATDTSLYKKDNDGKWVAPYHAAAAKEYGLDFRVVSSADLPTAQTKNFTTLLQVKGLQYSSRTALKKIRASMPSGKITYLGDLIRPPFTGYTKNDVYLAILENELCGPLQTQLISAVNRFPVFSTPAALMLYLAAEDHPRTLAGQNKRLRIGSKVLWNDNRYIIINTSKNCIVMQSDEGVLATIKIRDIENLLTRDQLKIYGNDRLSADFDGKACLISVLKLSPKAIDKATRCYQYLQSLSYSRKIRPEMFGLRNVDQRTIQRWQTKIRDARQAGLPAVYGLLPSGKPRQRKKVLPKEIHDEMQRIASELYFTPNAPSASACYRTMNKNLMERGLVPPSYKTFSLFLRALYAKHDGVSFRKGKRAAYKFGRSSSTDLSWVRTSDYPLMVAQMDGKLMDLLLVDQTTGELLGRPSLTLITLPHYGSAPIGMALMLAKESHSTAMVAIRDMVLRYGQGPGILTIDNGAAFNNIILDQLYAALGISALVRPPSQSRFSSEIERVFRTLDSEVIHGMAGNTKSLVLAREMSSTHNPQNYAVWTLQEFYPKLEDYLFNILWDAPAANLGTSPRSAFDRDVATAPVRNPEHCFVPERDWLLFLPKVSRGGIRRVHPGKGVSYSGFHYWHDQMSHPDVEDKIVDVRCDPYDCSYVYVQIMGKWVPATNARAKLKASVGLSSPDLDLIALQVLRASHARRREAKHGPALADLHRSIQEIEARLRKNRSDALNREVNLKKASKIENTTDASSKKFRLKTDYTHLEKDEHSSL